MEIKERGLPSTRIDQCLCGSVIEWSEQDAQYWKGGNQYYRFCECPVCGRVIEDPDYTKRQQELSHKKDIDDIQYYLDHKFRWWWERKKKKREKED